MVQRKLGLCLKEMRISRRYTQQEVAEKLHISRQAYSNYEQGRCEPSLSILISLSNIYNMNLITLLFCLQSTDKLFSQSYALISDKEIANLIRSFSTLSPEQRKMSIAYIHKLNLSKEVKNGR